MGLAWRISLLIIGLVVGIIAFGLLDILKLEGSEWTGALQNIFKKGSLLTVFYFALNRSIMVKSTITWTLRRGEDTILASGGRRLFR